MGKRGKVQMLCGLIQKARNVVLQDNAEQWFAPFRERPWYDTAVKGYIEVTEKLTLLLQEWQKDIVNVILRSEPVEKAEKPKTYRTAEYLDARYDRVVAEDIRDELRQLQESYQSRLGEFFDAHIGGVAAEAGKALLDTAKLPFHFNQYNTFVRSQLHSKEIHWAKQIKETTEKKVKQALAEGYEYGLSSYDIAQKVKSGTTFSFLRAEKVARTEVMASCNFADFARGMVNDDVVGYRWRSSKSKRTRASHKAADGQFQPTGAAFAVGNSKLLYQGDNSLGAMAKEIINCRCWLEPVLEDEADTLTPAEKGKLREGEIGRLASGKQGDTDGYSTIAEVFKIDYNDIKSTEEKMRLFEKTYLNSDKENALILSPTGIGMVVNGWEAGVNIELAHRDILKGSKVIHNHPKGWYVSGDAFSKDDLGVLLDYDLEEVRLVADIGGFTMSYTGEKIAGKAGKELYDQALRRIRERLGEAFADVEFEQLETMRELAATLKGLHFEEWKLNE